MYQEDGENKDNQNDSAASGSDEDTENDDEQKEKGLRRGTTGPASYW